MTRHVQFLEKNPERYVFGRITGVDLPKIMKCIGILKTATFISNVQTVYQQQKTNKQQITVITKMLQVSNFHRSAIEQTFLINTCCA